MGLRIKGGYLLSLARIARYNVKAKITVANILLERLFERYVRSPSMVKLSINLADG